MMIRKPSASVNYNEPLSEGSFTGTTGINISRPPTFRECVKDIVNLNVELDGALSLRKPLILVSKNEVEGMPSIHQIRYMFDKKTKLILSKSTRFVLLDENENPLPITFKFTNVSGQVNSAELSAGVHSIQGSFHSSNIINTASSTIVTGIFMLLSGMGLRDSETTKEEYGYRYMRITKVNEQFVVELMSPSVTTINSADTIPFNPDTTADNVYAIRDNYFAQTVSVESILAYTKTVQFNQEIQVVDEEDTLKSDTLKQTLHRLEE